MSREELHECEHAGIAFEVWRGRRGWLWLLSDKRVGAGTIGAATTRQEAMREARASIEEVVPAKQPSAAEIG